MNPANIAIVILAAGASRRLGRPKQLLVHAGKSLIRRAALRAIEVACGPVLVVLGYEAELIERELAGLAVEVIENTDWAEGMSSSIRNGIHGLEAGYPHVNAAILMLCDQPGLSIEILRELVSAHRRGHCVAACGYAGTVGPPALFARSLWAELKALKGDRGAKAIILAHGKEAAVVAFADGAIDIDTSSDL